MIKIPKNKTLILFDGICNLCNNSVQYIIKHDKKNRFVFATLQSDIGLKIIKKYDINPQTTDSILLYKKGENVKTKSTAVILIAKHLGFPINLLFPFLILPKSLRDLVYNFIAKNRYKWYGKKESCWIPTSKLKSKFLD